ncbi:unnamed protein product [Acanthosepion pharaonis]|uniref:Uncharacterized protein n=1 Tax=Acanthosepion pharaonis TaxID=158019 RepID=A0A812D2I1_ACAPH|nr:unnamed protein product [Sepia pharaonis]
MRSIDQVIIKVLLFHFWLQLEKNLFFRTLTLSHNLSQSSLYLQTIHLSFKFVSSNKRSIDLLFLHFIYLFLSQTTYFFSFSPPSFLPPSMTLFVSRYSFLPPCFYSSLTPPLFFFLPPSLSYSLFMSHSDSLSLPLYISHPASLFSPCSSLSIYLSLSSPYILMESLYKNYLFILFCVYRLCIFLSLGRYTYLFLKSSLCFSFYHYLSFLSYASLCFFP